MQHNQTSGKKLMTYVQVKEVPSKILVKNLSKAAFSKSGSKTKVLKDTSNEDNKALKEKASTPIKPIRSTRTQELRSQSISDNYKPQSANENKDIKTSRVNSRHLWTADSTPGRKNEDKNALENKTKTDKKTSEIQIQSSSKSNQPSSEGIKKDKSLTPKRSSLQTKSPGESRSQKFPVKDGPKKGEGDTNQSPVRRKFEKNSTESQSDSNDEDTQSPKKLTQNDSIAVISKSSRNLSKKYRIGDGKNQPNIIAKKRKKDTKIIPKTSAREMKLSDSLEEESDKPTRCVEEQPTKRKGYRVTEKKRFESAMNSAWYRGSKLFQKYLQILRSKSVLYVATEDLRPDQIPKCMKDRYEAEMIGLVPRLKRRVKGRVKEYYSY